MADTRRFPGAPLSVAGLLTILGQVVAAFGLVIQWIVAPSTFGAFGFPPGLIYLIGTAVIIWLDRRSGWSPAAGVAMGLWILVGGLAGGDLQANLATGDPGVITGNLVMAGGLLLSVIAGGLAIAHHRRSRQAIELRPVNTGNPRRLAVLLAGAGLILDALGDAAPEGLSWDGAGPLLFLVLGITVMLVPGRALLALTSLICFAFLGGGFSSPEFVARLSTPAEALPFAGALTQITGLSIAMIAALVAVLPYRRRSQTLHDA